MQQVRFYGGLLLGILLVLFALQNLQATHVRFLIWHADLPLVVTVLGSAAIGAIWASLWIAVARWRKQRHTVSANPR